MDAFGTHNLLVFLGAGILLNLTPGPDTLYIVGRSLAQGRKAGVVSALGIGTGAMLHTVFASVGLSAILATSALAFQIVKYAGAAYLIYLGIRLILEKASPAATGGKERSHDSLNRGKIYRQAVLTNLLNPKVALFFMAFLPQFVREEHASEILPFLFLGAIFVTTGTLWCLIVAWFAGSLSSLLSRDGKTAGWFRKLGGAVFIAIGLNLARSRS